MYRGILVSSKCVMLSIPKALEEKKNIFRCESLSLM
jgi:hypothetical protein